MENNSTYSTHKSKSFTMKDLEKASKSVSEHKEKSLPKGLGWFTKLMAKFGWHREYKIIVFDKDQLTKYLFAPPRMK